MFLLLYILETSPVENSAAFVASFSVCVLLLVRAIYVIGSGDCQQLKTALQTLRSFKDKCRNVSSCWKKGLVCLSIPPLLCLYATSVLMYSVKVTENRNMILSHGELLFMFPQMFSLWTCLCWCRKMAVVCMLGLCLCLIKLPCLAFLWSSASHCLEEWNWTDTALWKCFLHVVWVYISLIYRELYWKSVLFPTVWLFTGCTCLLF